MSDDAEAEVRSLYRAVLAGWNAAVSGVVPAGSEQLNPVLNAVQSLVAQRLPGTWRVWLYHNTPAAFHGQPDLAEALTADLSRVCDG